MRKTQKIQLLDILQTLREAHEAIKKYISRCEPEMARALLSDCQQSAIQIGAVVEESEGEDCPTVRLLEAYCEGLYQVSAGIPETVSAQKAYKMLNKALYQIEESVNTDISLRLEVVFLPYKASMWDSLYSVWRAADADPSCDAYVIPIPYYDRNPDGSLGTFHYEGGMYPDDVPVIRYDQYDFETRRPDAVFIHNGYDNYNYVTSIHPNFYSSQLKKNTEFLLYIPYFVSVDFVSEGMCTVPGCWNANRVFVQSEKIRQEYIRALQKMHLPGNGLENLEKKIIALGSPKFDVAISSRPENFGLPEQWRGLLTRPDGSRKRIVLYNTTITSMLEGNERYLAKLRTVLDTFHARDDVVLWWRPHPLIESTFRSMRPHLLPEYLRIVRTYREDGWGIFDDTADANRAVAYADYYYGDAGSALQASFQAAGKPVMLQRVAPAGGSLVSPCTLGADHERLYFSLLYSSAIFGLGLSTHKIHVVRAGHSTSLKPYECGVELENSLYFTPVAADSILKLGLEKRQFSSIPYVLDTARLVQMNPHYQKNWKFSWSFIYGGEVFFVGAYSAILCLNTRSEQVTHITGWPNAFRASDSTVTVTSCCQMEERLVMGGTTPVIVYFDMASKRFSTEEIPHKCAAGGFSTLAYGDGYLWLMAKTDGTILRFNPRTKDVIIYDQFPAGVLRCEDMCLSSVYIKGCLWLFSRNTNAVLRLCAKTEKILTVRVFPEGTAAHSGLPVLADGKIWVSRSDHPAITVYDPETADYTDIPIQVAGEISISALCGGTDYDPKSIHETVLGENGSGIIETLLNAPFRNQDKLLADWIASPDGKAGERIYQYVKDMILSSQM